MLSEQFRPAACADVILDQISLVVHADILLEKSNLAVRADMKNSPVQ